MSELTHAPFDTREEPDPTKAFLQEIKQALSIEGGEVNDTVNMAVSRYVNKIRATRREIQNKIAEAKRNLEIIAKSANLELAALQASCPHLNTTHHSDASGNNDSSDECLDCGRDTKYLRIGKR